MGYGHCLRTLQTIRISLKKLIDWTRTAIIKFNDYVFSDEEALKSQVIDQIHK